MFSKKALSRLIIPLVIEQFLAITVGVADVMMVSSSGEAAVSGVSLVDMINNLIISLFAALATGGAVVSAQYIGAQSREKACEAAYQLLLLALAISSVAAAACLVANQSLLSLLFGVIEPDVMENAVTYFWISAVSYPFLALYNCCAALYRSMGNSKVSMVVSFYMNIINVAGNALFIFVFHMGVAGVATASLISRVVAAVVMLILIKNPHNQIFVTIWQKPKLNWMMGKRILQIGIPNGLENSLFQLGRVLVLSIISLFGTVQIAANAVANNFASLACIPGQAIGLAIITVVGQCVGAGDYPQTEYYAKKIIKLVYLCGLIANGVMAAAMFPLLKVYNLSPESQRLAIILASIHFIFGALIWPLSFSLPNVLRAANDVRFTMVVAVFSMWTFRVGFSYILGIGFNWGAIGVWSAMVMDWIFRSALFIWRYRRGKWKIKYKPDPEAAS